MDVMINEKVVIREAKATDRDSIISFFNEFNLPYLRDRSYWIWLNRIVTTDYSIVAIAEYEGKVIAHYAIVPLDINVLGFKYRGAQGLNAVVSEKHRNKVQIYKVSNFAYKIAKKRGIDFMYAFPNKGYWEMQVKIEGCKLLSVINSYKIASNIYKELPREITIDNFKGDREDFFNMDKLVEHYNNFNNISVHKNLSYYINRYINHPQNLYSCHFIRIADEIEGFIVLKKYTNPYSKEISGHLIDYVISDNVSEKQLINFTNKYFNQKNIANVIYWPTNNNFKEALKLFPFTLEFESFPCIKFFNKELNIEIKDKIMNFKNWNMNMGDCDVF